ncbi:MAG: hypothetical protein Q4A59_02340 [Erysipelotrichaceae bacterium]|nr:hypothetical protein [Erysipelotrichaceae bacterium]
MHTNRSVTIRQTIPGTDIDPESFTGFINQTTDLITNDSKQLVYNIYGERSHHHCCFSQVIFRTWIFFEIRNSLNVNPINQIRLYKYF